jgi:3-oxoacyl-[acyl-carrier-protein] synthase II
MSVNTHKRIVITGLGPIGSVGIGKESFWQGVVNQETGVELVRCLAGKDLWEEYFLHKVKGFDIRNFDIDEDDLNYISKWKDGSDNKDLLFLLAAIKLALDDSKIEYTSKRNNLALVVTHENPGLEQLLWEQFRSSYQLLKNQPDMTERNFYNQLYDRVIKFGYETQSFMLLFHIARTFHVHEYSLFINSACASGLYAIEAAGDIVRLGKAQQVIVVSGDCPDIHKHLWFKKLNMYIPDGKTRPFSNGYEGFVMGEGATALVLEDYEHAKKRNAHIYAEYLGGSFKLEGWGVTSPMIGGFYYRDAIKQALINSKIRQEEIDLICAHGVGTKANDYYEVLGIKDIFKELNPPVTALKPYVGHNLGGSTLIELAILLLGMKNNFIPPILNTEETEYDIDLVRQERRQGLNIVLKTCSAFAGYNAASIFRRIT